MNFAIKNLKWFKKLYEVRIFTVCLFMSLNSVYSHSVEQ